MTYFRNRFQIWFGLLRWAGVAGNVRSRTPGWWSDLGETRWRGRRRWSRTSWSRTSWLGWDAPSVIQAQTSAAVLPVRPVAKPLHLPLSVGCQGSGLVHLWSPICNFSSPKPTWWQIWIAPFVQFPAPPMKYVDQAPAISGISIRDGTFDMINPKKSQELISKIPRSGFKFNPGISRDPAGSWCWHALSKQLDWGWPASIRQGNIFCSF